MSKPRRPGDRGDAQREVGRQIVGAAAEDVPLVDQRGDDARQRRSIDGDHPRQARVDREVEHPAAERRDAPVVGDRRVGAISSSLGLAERRPPGGASMKRQVVPAAPRRELERESGEIGLR